MFCPECGALLMPRPGKKTVECSCGYKSKEAVTALREKAKETKKVEVIDKEIEPHPLVDSECPKCKHTKAYFWTVQTRASDEPETKFFKCEKCKHIWRDYS